MVFGWFARLRPSAPRPVPRAPVEAPVQAQCELFARLTTPQLCALWRKSRAGLHAASTPMAQARVAAARGALLDELERREPEAMADWLQSGALEPDGPSTYLVR